MTVQNLDRIMEVIFRHEGGYVDHPSDPGGATNMGITLATLSSWRGYRVTKQEVRELTKDEAKTIYLARYWRAVSGDELPDGLDLVVMDGAVHSGPVRGVKWLQEALGVTADGIIGPITIAAAWEADEGAIERAIAARLSFLRGLSIWSSFGEGWTNRLDDTLSEAIDMFDGAKVAAPMADDPQAEDAGLLARIAAYLFTMIFRRKEN